MLYAQLVQGILERIMERARTYASACRRTASGSFLEKGSRPPKNIVLIIGTPNKVPLTVGNPKLYLTPI